MNDYYQPIALQHVHDLWALKYSEAGELHDKKREQAAHPWAGGGTKSSNKFSATKSESNGASSDTLWPIRKPKIKNEREARFQFGLICVIKTKLKSGTHLLVTLAEGRKNSSKPKIKRQPHILVRMHDDVRQKRFWQNSTVLTEFWVRFWRNKFGPESTHSDGSGSDGFSENEKIEQPLYISSVVSPKTVPELTEKSSGTKSFLIWRVVFVYWNLNKQNDLEYHGMNNILSHISLYSQTLTKVTKIAFVDEISGRSEILNKSTFMKSTFLSKLQIKTTSKSKQKR